MKRTLSILILFLFSSCTVTIPYKHIENNRTAKYYADSIRNAQIKSKAQIIHSKDTVFEASYCYTTYPAYYVNIYEIKDSLGKTKIIELPDDELNKRERDEFNSRFANCTLADLIDTTKSAFIIPKPTK